MYFFLLASTITLFIRKIIFIRELLLLLTLSCIGLFLSTPFFLPFNNHVSYPILGRCEEVLPHHHYIISAYRQNFYLSNYYADTNYRPGDSLTFYAHILPVTKNSNPGEFSYARYLQQKQVYHRLAPTTAILLTGHAHSLSSWFYSLRQGLLNKTAELTSDTTCRMLVNALCLGYKNDLDSEMQNLFITTGTMHLLSVSGLHTGAIYLLLLYLFRHTGLKGRKKELAILPLLWAYACLTGLSPSVVRASTILTFIAVGQAFNKSYIPLNSLAAAAFFTLLVTPSSLYSVSFLLSYSAYAGILVIYPALSRLAPNLPPVISQIYSCCCVTIAAQIPTLPISAFFFHTMNVNGFLANILAIPLATVLLYSSAICLSLPIFISHYLMYATEILSKILVGFLQLFAPVSFNLQELYPSAFTILLIYVSGLCTGLYLVFRKHYWIWFCCGLLCLLLLWVSMNARTLSNQEEIMIFHASKSSGILLNHHGYYMFLKNNIADSNKYLPYLRQNKLKPGPQHGNFIYQDICWNKSLFSSAKDTLFIASGSNPYFLQCQILIVTDNLSPQKVFGRGQATAYPHTVILDGSNSRFTIVTWRDFCMVHHIYHFDTFTNGGICLSLK